MQTLTGGRKVLATPAVRRVAMENNVSTSICSLHTFEYKKHICVAIFAIYVQFKLILNTGNLFIEIFSGETVGGEGQWSGGANHEGGRDAVHPLANRCPCRCEHRHFIINPSVH